MRVLALHPLCVAVFVWCVAAESSEKSHAPSKTAAHGILTKSMGRFQLAGRHRASMLEVNGGRLCVNGFGKKPPGYYFVGAISLKQCSTIAHQQPNSLGFRWGRAGFDYEVYKAYATPESQGGNISAPVDLGLLFSADGDFICTIYVAEDKITGQPFMFKKSNLSAHLDPKLKDGPASSVCYQRWTMAEFFKPRVSELWFCYMPASSADHCQKKKAEFYTQGKLFCVIFIFFLSVLGYIMSDMPQFETPLKWFARLLLNLELGMVSVGFLLTRLDDTEGALFFFLAYLIDVILGLLLFVPYYVMEFVNEDSPFNTAYLLTLAFSPCFLMEFMSYWSHFILLVGHQPLLVGCIAFLSTVLGIRFWDYYEEYMEEYNEERELSRKDKQDAIDKMSYASVPTEESPSDCCQVRTANWLTPQVLMSKLPRSCV